MQAKNGRSSNGAIRVLIEGPDLSGKSTLARALNNHLQKSNYCVKHLKGQFSERSWNRYLRHIDANQLSTSNFLNSLYIASSVFDRFLIKDDEVEQVIICESYVDRAIAYGIAVPRNPIARLALAVPRLFPRFDVVVLLTCRYEDRLERLAARPKPTRIDYITCDSRSTHDRLVSAYRLALNRHETVLHFDTGILSSEIIAREIARSIEQLTETMQFRAYPRGSKC